MFPKWPVLYIAGQTDLDPARKAKEMFKCLKAAGIRLFPFLAPCAWVQMHLLRNSKDEMLSVHEIMIQDTIISS